MDPTKTILRPVKIVVDKAGAMDHVNDSLAIFFIDPEY